MRIAVHAGSREELRPLFELAEDSAAQLDSYLRSGQILVALSDDQIVGHLQLVRTARPGEFEIKNMAVRASHRARGIGRLLIQAGLDLARADGASIVLVGTGAADVGNLRFYQRQGFRMRSIDRDAFTPATGYPDEIVIDGILLRDRVWLDQDLSRSPAT